MRLKPLDPRSTFFHLAIGALLAGGAGLTGCQGDESTGPGGDAKITLTSPQGGESFKVGDTLWIKWTVKEDPDPVEAVDPRFSPDSGKTWKTLSQSITPAMKAWGNYGWKIPDTLIIGVTKHALAGSKGLIRVEQYSTQEESKRSTLKQPITITAP